VDDYLICIVRMALNGGAPLVEYIESLLVGRKDTLSLQTCQLVDQISGRSIGVRADMTPQITRIDAHLLNREGVTRLCYCGNVFHARPAGLLAEREVLQIGAEIYGYAGVAADFQVIQLALESLSVAGVAKVRVDLNYPGITKAMIDAYPRLKSVQSTLYTYLKDKDFTSLVALLQQYPDMPPAIQKGLLALPTLYGSVDVLSKAKTLLPALEGVEKGLDALQQITQALKGYDVSIDLADVTGYDYHTGVIFALYADGWHEALVRGGRYDNMSEVFGRARAATGFSLDLRKLASGLPRAQASKAIKAPWSQDPELVQFIKSLREQGHIVVEELPNSALAVDEFIFDREVVLDNKQWILKAI
ncbi:ATP phosphoribosyltransferase regulatory subunit, partial [Pelistega indica]|uniref:ATP phosphoribosyltransferase regulatory subunit n=1 Tax=Pelistega indica TaxID=1414851 RepID=UPI001C449388